MDETIFFAFSTFVLIWFIIKDFLWERRQGKLLNRLMARNYEEFKYYEEKYKKDVKQNEKARDILIEQAMKEPSSSSKSNESDLEDLEEDWLSEEALGRENK
ncbi:MAG: hypothetical protein NC828_01595 [Candidatus Omnitrophica bacterium]|nr:hypothetical protein [Candidatus Omnitrophota bacterium]